MSRRDAALVLAFGLGAGAGALVSAATGVAAVLWLVRPPGASGAALDRRASRPTSRPASRQAPPPASRPSPFAELQAIEKDPARRARFFAALDSALAAGERVRAGEPAAVDTAAERLRHLLGPEEGPCGR